MQKTASIEKKSRENEPAASVSKTLADHESNIGEVAPEAGVPLFLQRSFTATPTPYIQQDLDKDEDQGETEVFPTLTVGEPDDPYEQEADRVADDVMHMPETPGKGITDEEEHDEPVTPIQAKRTDTRGRGESSHAVNWVVEGPGGGSPLPENTRARIEPVLKTDLSHVKVHSDTQSQEAAGYIHAKAFTHRNNIFLGRGQSPGNISLMAHEAAHVVQQQALAITPAIQCNNDPPRNEQVNREEAQRRADEVYDALNWLNNEHRAFRALSGLGEGMRSQVQACFLRTRGQRIQDYLKSQLSGDSLVRAFALLSSRNVHEQHTAVALALIPLGTRDTELFRNLERLNLAGRQELERRYNEAFRDIGEGSLKADLKNDLSGSDEKKALALLHHDLKSAERLYLDSVGIVGTNTNDVIRRIQNEWNRGPQSFMGFERDWNDYVRNGNSWSTEGAWTDRTLYNAMDSELGGEDWDIVQSVLQGHQRYKDRVGVETGPLSLEDQIQVESIELEVAEGILAAATTGGYTGAGTNEEQVFNAVRTIRTIWTTRIDRARHGDGNESLQDYERQWSETRTRIQGVIGSEMSEGGGDFVNARLLLQGNLTPADEIYIAKLDFDYDKIISLVSKYWACRQIDQVIAQSRRPGPENLRPRYDISFSIPITRGVVWSRMGCLIRGDQNDVQRGVGRLHLEISQGDSDSDLKKAYAFLNTRGIDPVLRTEVVRAYADRYLSGVQGENETQKFLSYLANRYNESTAYWDVVDLLNPLDRMQIGPATSEAVRRAEGRMAAASSGLFDSVLNDIIQDYDNITGEDTLATTAESLERLRFIAANAQAHPEELEVMLVISGRSSITELAGMEYALFRQRLEEVRQLKRAIAETIAIVAELAIELALTIVTGGGAAGAFIASMASTIAGMLIRESFLGQDYNLVSSQNLQQIVLAAASHGFGAIGRGFMDDVISPERLRQLGRAGHFLRDAAEDAIQNIGVQTLTLAFENQPPDAERLMAGVLSILGSSIGAGTRGDITRRLPVDASDVTRLRNRIMGNISQNVISGVADEGGELIRTGTGNLNGMEIAARFGRRTARSVTQGLSGGIGEFGGENLARDRDAAIHQGEPETVSHDEPSAPLPVQDDGQPSLPHSAQIQDSALLLQTVDQRIAGFREDHPGSAVESDPLFLGLIALRDRLRSELGDSGTVPDADTPPGSMPDRSTPSSQPVEPSPAMADDNPVLRLLHDEQMARLGLEPPAHSMPRDTPDTAIESHSTVNTFPPDQLRQAYSGYERALACADGREVGIFRNVETGEYVVRMGDESGINPPQGPYEGVLHYHPNPSESLLLRNPAPRDIRSSLEEARRSGGPVTEIIEFPLPGGQRGQSRFTVEPESGRVTLEYTGQDGSPVRETYDSIEDYEAHYHGQTVWIDPEGPLYESIMAGEEGMPGRRTAMGASQGESTASVPVRIEQYNLIPPPTTEMAERINRLIEQNQIQHLPTEQRERIMLKLVDYLQQNIADLGPAITSLPSRTERELIPARMENPVFPNAQEETRRRFGNEFEAMLNYRLAGSVPEHLQDPVWGELNTEIQHARDASGIYQGVDEGGVVAAARHDIEGLDIDDNVHGYSPSAHPEGREGVSREIPPPDYLHEQATEHAEQDVLGRIAASIQRAQETGHPVDLVDKTIWVRVEQTVCQFCRVGLNNPDLPEASWGVIRRFSEQYPELRIFFSVQNTNEMFEVMGGQIVHHIPG